MMQVSRRHNTTISRSNQSRVSNGSKLIAGVDGRSATARRYRDLIALYVAEIGGGILTASEAAQVRLAAALTVRSEALSAQIINGEAVDGSEIIRLASEARRALADIARKAGGRKPSDGNPDAMDEYLRSKAGTAA